LEYSFFSKKEVTSMTKLYKRTKGTLARKITIHYPMATGFVHVPGVFFYLKKNPNHHLPTSLRRARSA
jgi:hypothetical protein